MAGVAALGLMMIAEGASAGERLILDPGPGVDAGSPAPKSGAGRDDVDQRVKELEDQKAAVDSKSKPGVSVDVSGWAAGQVNAVKR